MFNIIPDYSVPGVANSALAGIIAIVLGTLLLAAVGYGIARALSRRRQRSLVEAPVEVRR